MHVNMKTSALKRVAYWMPLALGALILVAGTWSLGLWDPWEMNHAAVAYRMSMTPPVLVIDVNGPQGDVAKAVAAGSDGKYRVESAAGSGVQGLDALRDRTSEKVWAAVIMNPAALVDASEEKNSPAAVKTVANAIRSAAARNLSTQFVLIEDGTAPVDAAAVAGRIVSDGSSGDDAVPGIGRIVTTASKKDAAEAARHAACRYGMTAQFKASGKTQFLPPLEPFAGSLFVGMFGYTEFAARFSGVLFGLMTLVLIFLGARKVFGAHTASGAVFMMATSILFAGTARFVGAGMSEVFSLSLFGLALLGASGNDRCECRCPCHSAAPWILIVVSMLLCWLSGGMTTVATAAAIGGTWAIILPSRRNLAIAGTVLAVTGLLAAATFLPDCPWARQFRFTAATFGGGIALEARSFDFIVKEIGFGFFPWSAFIPLAVWMAVAGRPETRPERLLLLAWAVVPIITAMIFVRPFNQTMYLGVPGLALLTAMFVSEMDDDSMSARVFGFFAVGLFLVIMKDMTKSPAPLVTFLTTDPMFSKPGQGDGGFPPTVHISTAGKLLLAVMMLSMLSVASRISAIARKVHAVVSRPRFRLVALISCGALIVADIAVFTAVRWNSLMGTDGARELARLLLTGPDIAALYLLTAAVAATGYWTSIMNAFVRVFGRKAGDALTRAFDSFETLRTQKVVFAVSAACFACIQVFGIMPDITLHVSQKHIVDSWKQSSEKAPGPLFRHGQFSSKGSEDNNFYTTTIPEKASRTDVTTMLGDSSKRTFFILPAKQFSEINSAYRDATGERGIPLIDDRSSRIVLASSKLAPGETDRNWLTKATLSQKEFDALGDVERKVVNFDDTIELVGFQIDPPLLTRGTNPTLKMYFKVLKKVPKSYRVFMHVDKVGSSTRIHGDHWILNMVPESEDQDDCVGCYATTHWKKGDIVVDTYELKVPIGSPSGDYDVWMGLYVPSGSRLKVKSFDEDKIRHDGGDRVRIGRMSVR